MASKSSCCSKNLGYLGGFPGGSGVKDLTAKAEMWVRSLDGDPLEKKMAAHSSIVWKIPWTEGPGELQPMGSQRVRHN